MQAISGHCDKIAFDSKSKIAAEFYSARQEGARFGVRNEIEHLWNIGSAKLQGRIIFLSRNISTDELNA